MDLKPGSRLGPYEVVARIGVGGMGEVYQATDTNLKRQVAVKVLPASLATDADRLARFQREAEVLASLNHPNIAHIYGLEGQAGQAETPALVMEFVEGPTLAEIIDGSGLPIDDALRIARQIADALEAAHEQNIIHRDLKPANIKVRPDGTVKVLDFGLAKAMDTGSGGLGGPGGLSMSPTITTPAMTQAGMILGTAAYMAPEQARGRTVDRRADIWAFGVVLFEMLTGKRAFEDEDVSMTLSKVLQKEPDFDALPPTVPARVTQVLRLCLRKDPKHRVGDIRDVRLALDGAFETAAPSTASASGASGSRGPGLRLARASRLAWIVAGAAMLVAAALTVPTVRHLRESPPDPRAVNTTLLAPEGAELDFANSYALPALSPDGTRLVFGARADGKTQLWVRRLDSPSAQPLPGTENASIPFWSADSRRIAFGQESKLKKIDVQGGPPQAIADLPAPARGGSWNKDGVILVGVNAPGPILRVSASGGTPSPATFIEKGQEGLSHRRPWFLPDGRHFIYYTITPDGDMPASVASLDDAVKPGKVLTQTQSQVAYAQGYLLYIRESTLMAQPFDVDRLQTTGEPVPVAERISSFSASRYGAFTVSQDGSLVYLAGASGQQSRLVWKDRQGKPLGNVGEAIGLIGDVELSPDGTRVATSITGAGSTDDIWIYDTSRGIPTKFTFDSRSHRSPLWSPDGGTIYFRGYRAGAFDLIRHASNGSGSEETLLHDPTNKTPTSVSPDGASMLYTRTENGSDILVLPLAGSNGGAKPQSRAFLQTPFNEGSARFSPDGKWVAYTSNDSGQAQVFVEPFPGPGGKRQVSGGGGSSPRWRKDGKEIFYITNDGQLMAAEIVPAKDTLDVVKVQKLFDSIVTNRGMTYDVSPDGQRFLVVDDGAANTRPLTLLQNWTMSLRK